ncbi:MAG: oligoendopeptidase F [Candidatus Nanosalina sp.]
MEPRKREEVAEEYRWDLEKIYTGKEGWEEEFEETGEKIERCEDYDGRVTESPETLKEVLELYEEVMRKTGKLTVYARMKRDQDTRDQDAQALNSRAQNLSSRASSATSFIRTEIQQTDRETLEEYMETDELSRYRHYLEDVLRLKPHTRSKEVENVLAELGEVLGGPGEVYNTFTNADLEFPEVERDGETVRITQSNFTNLLKDEDRDFRKTVHEKFYDRLSEFKNTIGTTLEKQVRTNIKTARIRNYDSAREASLKPANIPVSVYDNLLEVVNENTDVLRRHVELKKEALGNDGMKSWDVYMPAVEGEQPEIGFDEAKRHVLNAVQPLGDEYVSQMERGLESRWIDVYETHGKRSGAYSGGAYDTEPYILMNYHRDISSMYTLAHELGHSMHSYFTRKNQPYIYSDYEIFVAETASTVNEQLLTHHLLNEVEDERLKRFALDHQLENFRTTLFRQAMFAEFEKEIHEKAEAGQPLTPDAVDEVYRGLKERFYGEEFMDDRISREWMRIPHFYWTFYVYQYSTGISAAAALKQKILSGEAENYLEFLKAGSSDYPLQLFHQLGIDMSSKSPVEDAIEEYARDLERLESLQ